MQRGDARPWHACTWLAWAVAATACLQIAPSPLYVVIVVATSTLAVSLYGHGTTYAWAYPVLVALALLFGALRVMLTALTTHGGIGALFELPSTRLPDALGGFTVGGTIEGPIVAQAAQEAFVVVGVVAVFAAFNAVVSHHELMQALPRAFHEVGLVVAVGIAFVPTTIVAIHDVREADRARTGGRIVRRGRFVRQIVPVLETGLERAITLAESMDARGFARGVVGRGDHASAWCGALGLLALASAFVALVASEATVALVLVLAGVGSIAIAITTASRASDRVRYRPRRLTVADVGVMAGVLAAPLALTVISMTGDATLAWTTSPLRWPALHVVPLLALAALCTPFARRPALAPHPTATATASTS